MSNKYIDKILERKGITLNALAQEIDINWNNMYNMYHNKVISYETASIFHKKLKIPLGSMNIDEQELKLEKMAQKYERDHPTKQCDRDRVERICSLLLDSNRLRRVQTRATDELCI